jgi:threonine-phosphate decarboxylase
MKPLFDHGGNLFAIARSMGVAPEQLLDFSASINPLGPAPGVKSTLSDAFDRLCHYPERTAQELREALARHHGLDPDRIIAANGSTELIYLVPRLVAGKRALIIAPPFSEYARGVERAGYRYDYFTLNPEDGFSLSLPRLAKELAKGYDLLYFCNPGNPTGALLPLDQCRELLELCQTRGTFLVLDEAFMDFCEEHSARLLAATRDRCLLLRSMTKFYAIPGLRLGYAIATPAVIQQLAQLQEPWSLNTAAQVAGIASLADQDYRDRSLAANVAERARLSAGLAQLPGLSPFPSAANFILVQLQGPVTAAELYRALLQERIIIRDCENFHGLGTSFFRVAVRSGKENEQLLEKLGGILKGSGGRVV